MSTLHRDRKGELTYRSYLKNNIQFKNVCVFCEIEKNSNQIVKETKTFRVIINAFPYTIWDSCTVLEHMMIVPKRHIQSVSRFTKDEIDEYHRLTASYEKKGYDLYARGLSSTMKSVAHQHTHLIKTDGIKIRGMIYNENPLIHKIY